MARKWHRKAHYYDGRTSIPWDFTAIFVALTKQLLTQSQQIFNKDFTIKINTKAKKTPNQNIKKQKTLNKTKPPQKKKISWAFLMLYSSSKSVILKSEFESQSSMLCPVKPCINACLLKLLF